MFSAVISGTFGHSIAVFPCVVAGRECSRHTPAPATEPSVQVCVPPGPCQFSGKLVYEGTLTALSRGGLGWLPGQEGWAFSGQGVCPAVLSPHLLGGILSLRMD